MPSHPFKVRRLSAAVALALTGTALPFAARAEAPQVSWNAPLSGATISGTISGSTCSVNATSSVGMQRVIFWINQMQINNDYSSPWNCTFDSTVLPDGNYTMWVQAYSSKGELTTSQIPVAINNTNPTSSTPSTTSTSSTSTTSTSSTSPSTSTTSTTTTSTSGSTPPPGSGSLAVWFKAPYSGETVSGILNGGTSCYVKGTGSIASVAFSVDGASIGTDSNPADGMNCQLDTTKLANGTHSMRANATDSSGNVVSDIVSFNVQNTATTSTSTSSTSTSSTSTSTSSTSTSTTNTPAPTSGSLSVWFKSPLSGATVSGTLSGWSCYVKGTGSIAKVGFSVDGTSIGTDTNPADGMNCTLDTTKLANGSHSMRANATDSSGNVVSDIVSFNVQNSTSSSTSTTNTPPTVSWSAPAAGATLSGTVSGTGCAVSASDSNGISKVAFALNSTALNTASASPYDCSLDTTKFANGTYNLVATATDSLGASTSASRTVSIANTTTSSTSTTSGTPIASSDIIEQAQAGTAFSQQSGYTGAVIGTYPDVSTIPESGINSFALSNGETLRLGKQLDPTGSGKEVLAFQLDPNDPVTSGSHRSEFEFPYNIQLDKVYWVAYSVYVYDWGTLPSGDESLFGTQLHSSDTSLGLSPAFTVATFDGSTMRFSVQYDLNSPPSTSTTTTIKYPGWSQPGIPIPFGQWVDFVFKFRESQSSSGFLQAWMNGSQVVNYSGPLGYNTPGYLDYFKFGYYNWSSFSSDRKVLERSPIVVQDPTGSTYQASDLRSYVDAH